MYAMLDTHIIPALWWIGLGLAFCAVPLVALLNTRNVFDGINRVSHSKNYSSHLVPDIAPTYGKCTALTPSRYL